MDRGFNQVPSAAGYLSHDIEEMIDMFCVCASGEECNV